jgi:hypothetical protein
MRTLTLAAVVTVLLAVTTSAYLLTRRTLTHAVQTLDTTRSQALLEFQLRGTPHRLVIDPAGGAADVELLLLDASRGRTVYARSNLQLGAARRPPYEVSLADLPSGDYYLRIQLTRGSLLFAYIVDQGGGWPASLALTAAAMLGAADLALLVLATRSISVAGA